MEMGICPAGPGNASEILPGSVDPAILNRPADADQRQVARVETMVRTRSVCWDLRDSICGLAGP